ncbi:MAG: hypothetical protein H7A53_05280 [Akkermansiaceae bacterium]|nr:hypothetical protein [Akkermansiaceae bacterium]
MAKSHEHFALSGLPELLDFPIRDPKAADEKWGIENLSRYLADPDGQIFAVEGVVECLESIGHWLLLQIDQMEEVFAETVNKGDRAAFFGFLHRLAQSGRVWVLATMRSEFFREIAREPELRSLLGSDGGYILPPPDTQSWSEIIRYPAMAARLNWERSMESRKIGSEAASKEWLDEQILDEIEGQSDALPLLEFCLERLYSKRSGTLLTWAAYEEMGGIRGAIAKVADDAFQNLPATAREALDFVFANLVRVDETTTRRRANLDQLQRHHGADEFLFAFQEAKLLSTGDEDGITVVTLVHESLLTHWPVLAEWIEAASERSHRSSEIDPAGGTLGSKPGKSEISSHSRSPRGSRTSGGKFDLSPLRKPIEVSPAVSSRRRPACRSVSFSFATVVFPAAHCWYALADEKRCWPGPTPSMPSPPCRGTRRTRFFCEMTKSRPFPT